MLHKLAMILFFVLILAGCTQNRGYRGGVRGSYSGNYNIEDVDRTHRDMRSDYEKEQQEERLKQLDQEDSYGY